MGVYNCTKRIGEKKEIKTNNQANPKDNNSQIINNNNNNDPTQLKINHLFIRWQKNNFE